MTSARNRSKTPRSSGSRNRSAQQGFTLVEMLIALMIFGLLAAAGVAMLSFSVRAQAAATAKLADIAALNRLTSALSADLGQAVARATRDENGRSVPAFVGVGGGEGTVLQFVRGGWTNLDDAARPGEQKLAYRLVDRRLERVAYPLLDGAAPLTAATMVDDVAAVALRYRIGGAWSDSWIATPQAPLPRAVELSITRTGGTRFRALFLVGTGYRPPPLTTATGGGNAP